MAESSVEIECTECGITIGESSKVIEEPITCDRCVRENKYYKDVPVAVWWHGLTDAERSKVIAEVNKRYDINYSTLPIHKFYLIRHELRYLIEVCYLVRELVKRGENAEAIWAQKPTLAQARKMLRQKMTPQELFKSDMEKAGLEPFPYQGRNGYKGWAVKVHADNERDTIRKTKIKLQVDSMGKFDVVIYPAQSMMTDNEFQEVRTNNNVR